MLHMARLARTHLLLLFLFDIPIPQEMQHPMDDVEGRLLVRISPVLPSVFDGGFGADEDVSKDTVAPIAVVDREGNAVGRGGVVEIFGVERADLFRRDEMDRCLVKFFLFERNNLFDDALHACRVDR